MDIDDIFHADGLHQAWQATSMSQIKVSNLDFVRDGVRGIWPLSKFGTCTSDVLLNVSSMRSNPEHGAPP